MKPGRRWAPSTGLPGLQPEEDNTLRSSQVWRSSVLGATASLEHGNTGVGEGDLGCQPAALG